MTISGPPRPVKAVMVFFEDGSSETFVMDKVAQEFGGWFKQTETHHGGGRGAPPTHTQQRSEVWWHGPRVNGLVLPPPSAEEIEFELEHMKGEML